MAQSRAIADKTRIQIERKKAVPPEPSPAAELEAFDPSQIDVLLPPLLARHAPITDDDREAFALLLTDTQAEALGTRTQAADIRALAMVWAPKIDTAIREQPAAVQGYPSERFVYMLECVQALHGAIRTDEEKRSKVGSVRTVGDAVRAQAKLGRDALYRPLRTYAGQRQAERAALATAYGTVDTDDNLLLSLTSLAKLGQEWLTRPEKTSIVLAKAAGLNSAVVAATLGEAKKLKAAMSDKTMHGAVRSVDSVTVNRLEGRLTYELLEARRIFKDANERTGLVANLVPSKAVRNVFIRKTAAGGEEDAQPDPTTPADGPADGAAKPDAGKKPPKG